MTGLKQSRAAYFAFMWLLATVLIGASAAVVRAADNEPPDLSKLEKELKQAYDSGNYQKALETAEKMHELKPDDPDTMYNMACMHCLLGHKDKAFEWLEKAIDAGFADADHLANDDDLKTIRGEDRFRALVKQLREGDNKGAAKKDAEKETKKADGKKEKKEAEKKQEKKAEKKEQPAKSEKPAKPEQPEKPARPEKDGKPGKYQMSDEEKAAKVQALTEAAIKASGEKEPYKALALTLEARVLADIGLTNYNVACMYSLLGQKDDAFRYLERAIELDNMPTPMAQQMEGDSDLDSIRKDPRYAELLKRAGGEAGAKKSGETGKKPSADQPQGKPVDPEWQVTVPKGLDKSKRVPLIVALHPRNGNMEMTIERWKDVAAEMGAILLTPQGTFRLADDRYEWGRNLDAIEENVMDAIDEVMEDHQIDKKKIIVVGFSQGAWAAWSMALRNPDVFRGAIPVAGRLADNWQEDIEEDAIKNLKIYAMVGADDDEQLVKSGKQAAKKLKDMGLKVELKTFDGVGHDFPKNAKEEQLKALKFVLED
jgi:predicted esterase